jgi:hypothetical protein
MYHLHQEAEPSEMTALEAVIDHIKKEMDRLHAQVCVEGGLGGRGGGRRGGGEKSERRGQGVGLLLQMGSGCGEWQGGRDVTALEMTALEAVIDHIKKEMDRLHARVH